LVALKTVAGNTAGRLPEHPDNAHALECAERKLSADYQLHGVEYRNLVELVPAVPTPGHHGMRGTRRANVLGGEGASITASPEVQRPKMRLRNSPIADPSSNSPSRLLRRKTRLRGGGPIQAWPRGYPMNWKLKSLAMHFLAHAPGSLVIHRWLQRNCTGRYLDCLSDDVLAAYNYHVRNFERLPAPEQSSALEFGVGRNLLTPLLLSAVGARQIFAYDIDRLATVEQINHVIRQLRMLDVPCPGQAWREIENIEIDLKNFYRINYFAPCDVRHTALPTESIDFVYSTSTLEHISRADIVSIVTECRRLCSPSALMSFIIDYHDHYSTFDIAITRFNFYRYSESTWKWFNPRNHFQNRMRHSDYEALFETCGLIALEKRAEIPPYNEKELQDTPLSDEFTQYSTADLAALNGFFLLRASHAPAA
jgi:hypothetical protein